MPVGTTHEAVFGISPPQSALPSVGVHDHIGLFMGLKDT